MRPDPTPVEIPLPSLPDEAAVALHDFLNEVLLRFESHYFAQIHRFCEDQFANKLTPSPPHRPPSGDDPF